jgi:hypothetical protein
MRYFHRPIGQNLPFGSDAEGRSRRLADMPQAERFRKLWAAAA